MSPVAPGGLRQILFAVEMKSFLGGLTSASIADEDVSVVFSVSARGHRISTHPMRSRRGPVPYVSKGSLSTSP